MAQQTWFLAHLDPVVSIQPRLSRALATIPVLAASLPPAAAQAFAAADHYRAAREGMLVGTADAGLVPEAAWES